MSADHELVCRDFVALLLQYLAGELPADHVAVFDRHLGECPSCVAYMKTYQQAVRMGREAMRAAGEDVAPLPDDLATNLVSALLAVRGRSS